MRLLNVPLLMVGFTLIGSVFSNKGDPRCKKPNGKLGQSRPNGCGQRVCQKNGKNTEWKKCPAPVTGKEMGAKQDEIINLLLEVIKLLAPTPTTTISSTTTEMSSTTPTTTTTTTTTTLSETTTESLTKEVVGILIAGGHPNERTTELFIPRTGKTCQLASLPEARMYFTMNSVGYAGQVLACGGYNTRTSCVEFNPNSPSGTWSTYNDTIDNRYGHASWVTPAGLVLIGGAGNPTTSEIIDGGKNFSITTQHYACSIDLSDSIILTGGEFVTLVKRYNLQGLIEDLPNLNRNRHGHGCGFYYEGDSQILVVAGGWTGYYRLSSTETHITGSSSWTSGNALPWATDRLSSLSLDNQVLLIGGHSTRLHDEIYAYNGTWRQVGTLQTSRDWAASTKIYSFGQLDITGCE